MSVTITLGGFQVLLLVETCLSPSRWAAFRYCCSQRRVCHHHAGRLSGTAARRNASVTITLGGFQVRLLIETHLSITLGGFQVLLLIETCLSPSRWAAFRYCCSQRRVCHHHAGRLSGTAARRDVSVHHAGRLSGTAARRDVSVTITLGVFQVLLLVETCLSPSRWAAFRYCCS